MALPIVALLGKFLPIQLLSSAPGASADMSTTVALRRLCRVRRQARRWLWASFWVRALAPIQRSFWRHLSVSPEPGKLGFKRAREPSTSLRGYLRDLSPSERADRGIWRELCFRLLIRG
jgi:hypothetical protein